MADEADDVAQNVSAGPAKSYTWEEVEDATMDRLKWRQAGATARCAEMHGMNYV